MCSCAMRSSASTVATGGRRMDLTFDHVIPRSRGGRTTWENVVTACGDAICARDRGCRRNARCSRSHPRQPTTWELQDNGRGFPAQLSASRVGATTCTGTANWTAGLAVRKRELNSRKQSSQTQSFTEFAQSFTEKTLWRSLVGAWWQRGWVQLVIAFSARRWRAAAIMRADATAHWAGVRSDTSA